MRCPAEALKYVRGAPLRAWGCGLVYHYETVCLVTREITYCIQCMRLLIGSFFIFECFVAHCIINNVKVIANIISKTTILSTVPEQTYICLPLSSSHPCGKSLTLLPDYFSLREQQSAFPNPPHPLTPPKCPLIQLHMVITSFSINDLQNLIYTIIPLFLLLHAMFHHNYI